MAGRVPAGAVEQQHAMRSASDHGRDIVERHLHRLGVDIGQRQGGPDTAPGQIAPKRWAVP